MQAEFRFRHAAPEECPRIVRVKPDRLVVVGGGFGVAVRLGVGTGAVDLKLGIVRVEADLLGALGDALFEPAQIGLIRPEAGPAFRAAAVV